VPKEKQEAVNLIGAKLAKAVNDPRREFRFSVVPSEVTNTFALPGGFVFVTEPLVDLCDGDRNKLAFYIGHEIGHIRLGHARQQLTAGVFLNAVTARLAGAGRMLRDVLTKGYARELELEADREAVRLSKAAGFNETGGLRALHHLTQIAFTDTRLAEYLISHPPIADRIREVELVLGRR
jgi:putative metalloprotease